MGIADDIFVKENKVAIYGLGTETERFLTDNGKKLQVICLLDGFRNSGEMFGYPIMPIEQAIVSGVRLIIVVARPGSCKAIAKRISDICRENRVELYDVRGKDLLASVAARYDFASVFGESRKALFEKIHNADIISFDLFDTLVMRKVYSYTDVFELTDMELRKRGIVIPDFAKRRLYAEKELSKQYSPTLEDIYGEVLRQIGGCFLSAEELAEIEWNIDFSTMIPRNAVCSVFHDVIKNGKKVIIVTDSYYGKNRMEKILSMFGIIGYENLIISCEYRSSKTLELYDMVISIYANRNILHIGDDETADIAEAGKRGIRTYRIFSGVDLFNSLGELGTEDFIKTLADRLKCGLFISRVFNDPFQFETEDKKVTVSNSKDIGYLFSGAMISDFILWMSKRLKEEDIQQILFCARDGYLPGRLYRKKDPAAKCIYFLASRMAVIRAGMESNEDIDYVDSMKFFGSPEEAAKIRFGIELSGDVADNVRRNFIMEKAHRQKENYRKYIEKLNIYDGKLAIFDFVAKGTTQMYLERIFGRKMKGFFFLQLEPEFMADKGLDIEPFYLDEEKNSSAIFDNYYILETMLTSPYPQIQEFDEDGNPEFVSETRSKQDIRCFERMQKGITEFFEDYTGLLPEEARAENKKLDEVFLALVNRIEITDPDFLALKVEDPFFGRMTDIKDVIG